MNKILLNIRTNRTISWSASFIVGAFIIGIYYFALFYLGDQALIVYHDQLDGEITSYMLSAKHFGANYIPEMFGGTTITPSTPFFCTDL